MSVGLLILAIGLVFMVVTRDKLIIVFPKMRSNITTKVGGAILMLGGAALMMYLR